MNAQQFPFNQIFNHMFNCLRGAVQGWLKTLILSPCLTVFLGIKDREEKKKPFIVVLICNTEVIMLYSNFAGRWEKQ